MNRVHRLLGILFLVWIFTIHVSACNPAVPAICEAYSRAQSVFVGTLTKIEKINDFNRSEVYAHFTVKKIYKGMVTPTQIVRFDTGDCGVKLTEIGKDYFVYDEPYVGFASVANLTDLLENSQPSVKYAESLSNKNPIFTISGWIAGLAPDEMKNVVVEINDGAQSHRIKLNDNYGFNFIVKRNVSYEVRVDFPTDGTIWTELIDGQFKSLYKAHGRTIHYSVQFKPNECDFRKIEINKDSR